VPWETSFNDGFCAFKVDGFCYGDPQSENRIVREPTHSPPFAAAFEIGIGTDAPPIPQQNRCVREGVLPEEAYYGAWFYLPTKATDATDNWNLFHFQGGQPGGRLDGLWDVSLAEGARGALVAIVYDRFNESHGVYRSTKAIPFGRWFQLEFLLKRAGDATGAVALFQDGAEVIRVDEIATDDTPFGQWYVGNWAQALTPSNYTLYVDDVTVRLSK